MLYKTLKRQIERTGLTEDLKGKIDIFYLVGRITEDEYKDLMGIEDDEPINEIIEEYEN